jgi:gliding motility-associated-like protein
MKKVTLISFLSFTFIVYISAQNPCILGLTFSNILIGKNVKLSTIKGNGTPNLSVDGIISNDESLSSKTYTEDAPYWETDLGENLTLESIKIFYPSSSYSEAGLKNYYVLMSEAPFSDDNLEHQIEAPSVSYVYVESYKPSGYAIALNYKQAQYIRVQLAERGILTISEIQIPGTALHDICGNGIDDDCDGKKDCEDTDCGIVIQNIDPKMPSCPTCNDGKIGLQNSGKNIKYSIDGGKTFNVCGNNCTIGNLPEGDHEITVKNALTGCETKKTVSLRAKVGPEDQCCPNGGFENGKFDKWKGGENDINNSNIPNNPIVHSFSSLNTINTIPSGTDFDPSIGSEGFPLTSPTGSPYIAQLGDNHIAAQKTTMTYCMTVSDCNKDFVFNYALVLQNPQDDKHSPSEQPKFGWKIKDNNNKLLRDFPAIVADKNNPYFQVKNPNAVVPIVYRPWTCEKIDLEEFMGKDICIEFTSFDCTEGGHFAYAYIDGLCKKNEAVPKPLAISNKIFCKNQKATISGKESKNFNKYSWEVCRYVNGIPNNCFTTQNYYDKEPVLDDAIAFFFGAPHNPANPLACGDKFKVTLNLDNGCETKTTSTDFTYICDEAPVINYPDIIVCSNNDVMINGTTTNCPNCTYTWSPPQFLGDPTSPNPVIQGGLNTLALQQVYTVTAKSPNGCITPPDMVKVYQSKELVGNISFSFNELFECEYEIFVDIEFQMPVDINGIEVDIEIKSENRIFFVKGIPITTGTSKTHRFKLADKRKKCLDADFKAIVKYKASTIDFNQVGRCALTAEYSKKGNSNNCFVNLYAPNIFTPNGDGVNDVFNLFFSKNMITFAQLAVFDRWGNNIFLGEVTAPLGSFLTGTEPEITWDGSFRGIMASFDVHVFVLDYKSCGTPTRDPGFDWAVQKVTIKGTSLKSGNIKMAAN